MLGEAIRAILLSNSTVSSLVGTRIYPEELPLNCSFPAISYSVISDPFQIHMRSARMQISCWADDYTSRETLKTAVESTLKFYTGVSMGETVEIIYPIGYYPHVTDGTGFSFIPIDFAINYYTN